MRRNTRATDGMITEAELGHGLWVEQIAAIENNRCCHFSLHDLEIDVGELSPFRGDNERFGSVSRFESGIREDGAGDRFRFPRLVHGLGIVNRNARSLL